MNGEEIGLRVRVQKKSGKTVMTNVTCERLIKNPQSGRVQQISVYQRRA